MKALLLVAASLAILAFLPAGAHAQMSSAVVIRIEPAEGPIVDDSAIVLHAVVTYVADDLAALNVNGVPVEYTVTQAPAWATVTLTPPSDVFPPPAVAPAGASYVVTRTLTITVSATSDLDEDVTDFIEMSATTHPSAPLATSATGKGQVQVQYLGAEDEPCPEHAGMTHEEMAALAVDAANAYNAEQREQQTGSSDDVAVQDASASRVPMPWIAVVGFALVGAGVGLVLRRKYA